MRKPNYLTVPEELLPHASRIAEHYETYGYSVHREYREAGYPNVPAMVVTRHRRRETVIVEVQDPVDISRLEEWARFARSRDRDTRVVVCMPADGRKPQDAEVRLRESGVGLFTSNDRGVLEVIPAVDQAMRLDLPDLAPMHIKLRRVLGPAYEKFRRGEWRDGFGDACQAMESEARRYLRQAIRTSRVRFVDAKGNYKTYNVTSIDRMPIGPLAIAFSQIEVQTKADATILNALNHINPDRVGKVHRTWAATTERSLRKNVPKHMWIVLEGLKAALGVP